MTRPVDAREATAGTVETVAATLTPEEKEIRAGLAPVRRLAEEYPLFTSGSFGVWVIHVSRDLQDPTKVNGVGARLDVSDNNPSIANTGEYFKLEDFVNSRGVSEISVEHRFIGVGSARDESPLVSATKARELFERLLGNGSPRPTEAQPSGK